MKAAILKKLADRASGFSGKCDIAARAVLEVKSNKLYISTCDGDSGFVGNNDYLGPQLDCAIQIDAFCKLLNAFSDEDDVIFKMKNNRLYLTGKRDYNMPTYPSDQVFNFPAPKEDEWIPSTKQLGDCLHRIVSLPIKNLKSFTNTPITVLFDNEYISMVTRSISYFEKNTVDLNAHLFLNTLPKRPRVIEKYYVSRGHLFFHGEKEWCMLPQSTARPLMYGAILKEVQKHNNTVIKINVEVLRDLAKRTKAVKDAEETIQSSEIPFIDVEVENDRLTIRTKLSEESIEVESNSKSPSIRFNVVSDFLTAIAHDSFVCDQDEIALHVGNPMSLVAATSGSAKLVGALWRS